MQAIYILCVCLCPAALQQIVGSIVRLQKAVPPNDRYCISSPRVWGRGMRFPVKCLCFYWYKAGSDIAGRLGAAL